MVIELVEAYLGCRLLFVEGVLELLDLRDLPVLRLLQLFEHPEFLPFELLDELERRVPRLAIFDLIPSLDLFSINHFSLLENVTSLSSSRSLLIDDAGLNLVHTKLHFMSLADLLGGLLAQLSYPLCVLHRLDLLPHVHLDELLPLSLLPGQY